MIICISILVAIQNVFYDILNVYLSNYKQSLELSIIILRVVLEQIKVMILIS